MDSAIAWVGVVGGVVGPSGQWLAWASYRDAQVDAAADLTLRYQAGMTGLARWRAQAVRATAASGSVTRKLMLSSR